MKETDDRKLGRMKQTREKNTWLLSKEGRLLIFDNIVRHCKAIGGDFKLLFAMNLDLQ